MPKRHEFSEDISLSAVMDTVLDGLIIIDQKGFIHAFNQSAERIFGYLPEEVIGNKVNMLMPEPYQSSHDKYISNYISSHDAKVIGIGREVQGKRKNGEIFPMELGVNEMKIHKNLMFVGTVRDISDRKKSEKAIEGYINALKMSNQELDDFAYIASHDLKEPLRGLSNNALFLKEDNNDKLDDVSNKRIDRIVFLTERMEQLINDLLYFARLGKQDLAIKEVDMNELIHDVLVLLEPTILEKNVKVTIVNKLPRITCDFLRIAEVFRNLITNAIKYNDKKKKTVEIGYQEDKGVFFVKDNGIGIDKAFYNDIFRIFKRLNSEKDDTKGTGVGLTFVKKILERHRGRFWLESEIGEGTVFYFTIGTKEL